MDQGIQSKIIEDALSGIIDLFQIPSDYHFILLKDKESFFKALANTLPATGVYVAGSSRFADIKNKYSGKIIFLNDPENDLSKVEHSKMPLIFQDVDLATGRKILIKNPGEIRKIDTLSFIHQDITYSSPSDPLDYENIESFSFQTSYGFGMGQDLVVWILRNNLFNKAKEQFKSTFEQRVSGPSKNRRYVIEDKLEIIRVYVLGMIIKDFLNRGLSIIRNEIKYKSIILNNSVNDNPNLKPLVEDQLFRSQNIICAKTNVSNEKILNFMSENRIDFDVLKGPDTSTLIRIANYPVHSKEQMEYLSDLLVKL